MMDDNFRVKTFAFGTGVSKKLPSGWWIDQDDDQGLPFSYLQTWDTHPNIHSE